MTDGRGVGSVPLCEAWPRPLRSAWFSAAGFPLFSTVWRENIHFSFWPSRTSVLLLPSLVSDWLVLFSNQKNKKGFLGKLYVVQARIWWTFENFKAQFYCSVNIETFLFEVGCYFYFFFLWGGGYTIPVIKTDVYIHVHHLFNLWMSGFYWRQSTLQEPQTLRQKALSCSSFNFIFFFVMSQQQAINKVSVTLWFGFYWVWLGWFNLH